MQRLTARTETLRRAAEAVGGEIRLAEALRIRAPQARRFLTGEDYPPMEVYQRALDLLIAVGTN